MRTPRIFQTGDYHLNTLFSLNPEASKHVSTVLRMQVGQALTLFSGDNREFSALIHAIKKKQVIVQINAVKEISRESPLSIHLAQSISKGDKMDLVVQKATELGVFAISPIISQRTVVRLSQERMEKKLELWRSIALAACEQSGRNRVPMIYPPQTLESYVKNCTFNLKLILSPEGNTSWREHHIGDNLSLLVGPEGGLSQSEIFFAINHGFQSMCLGPRILRTETAAISVLSILQALAGDL